MISARIVFSVFAALLTAQPGFAQSDQQGASTSQIRYHVEVIAFEYQGPDTAAGEDTDRLLVQNYLPDAPFDIDEYNRVQKTVSYTNITDLGGALERLRASPQYSVLAASAWVQPLLGHNQAVDVPLGDDFRGASGSQQDASRGPMSSRLTGSVRIYGDQLLFVDMRLHATLPRRAPVGGGTGQSRDASATGAGDEYGRRPLDDGLRSYRIEETRRIKLEEAHYFDHPYIGAVLYVRRYEGS